jgi:hypothetical protein
MANPSMKARYVKYYFWTTIGIAFFAIIIWIILSLLNCRVTTTPGIVGVEIPTIQPFQCLFNVEQIPEVGFIWAIAMVISGIIMFLIYELKSQM